ncbi:phosphonate metabolism transcriptional regulator PhnF [Paenibacillus alkalitolerans]|uniref:phosphonate metabolism transcriptional regulator PhnF n=1 Tax=Paenibacillus alkalitolerans TaxID=2799335 RepID=UPI0018F740EC|nr:phosphonate metabolism transcriptional regulator PhnF [Paenibacillus alkalitolerans]
MYQRLENADPIPKFIEIADILQGEIESGKYRVGDKIPSEAQLCRRFHENRYTIRQAIDLLVNTGVIRSHQGKGHYVCEKPLDIQYTITASMRFSEVMKQLGCNPEAKLLRKEVMLPPDNIKQSLQLQETAFVYRLEILRYANRIPLTWNVTWLPVDIFPGLLQYLEPMHSLYAVLEHEYGVRLERMWSTFQATYPNAIEASYLQIPPNQNLLHIESLMRDKRNRLVEYTSAKYRGDLCRVSIHF